MVKRDASEAGQARPQARAGAPALWAGAGPRVVEAALLDHLQEWGERVARDPARLAAPLRVVVPSQSLREHVVAAALRARGRPLAGVVVQSLFALALEVHGRPPRVSPALVALEVERRLPAHPALARALDGVRGGARAVAAAVDDLLDAGFRDEHASAVVEALGEAASHTSPDVVERAAEIVALAIAVRRALAARGYSHRADVLARAADALRREPARLAAGEVVVHGFAEATGVATDLLGALAAARPTTVLLDLPPEPGRPARTDPGARFAHRLRDALAPLAVAPPFALPTPPGLEPRAPGELVDAPGREAEVRAVAGRIREQLDADPSLAPERIGVVARQLGPYAHHVRAHFTRLGVPFSGVGAMVAGGGAARRAAAFAAVLEQGDASPADRWLDAFASLPAETRGARADARLALRVLGAARLGDVAALSLPQSDVVLPVRHGLGARSDVDAADDAGASDGDERAGSEAEDGASDAASREGGDRQRRSVAAVRVRAWVESARRIVESLRAWPASAPAAEHVRRLRALARDELRWGEDDVGARALAGLASALPSDLELARAEALALAVDALTRATRSEPLGGAGGGVAVLGAMEARARTFDRLYVLGLERDVFPRVVREDALLPDAVRRALRSVLPELPVKATGHDEERYLFAQLAAASPHVVLGWPRTSDDGKRRVRSAFVDRLTGAPGGLARRSVAAVHEGSDAADAVARTPREWALAAGVDGSGAALAAWARLLPAALAEGTVAAELAPAALAALGAARARVAAELSRGARGGAGGPGAYFGAVGPVRAAGDPRAARRYVTALERTASCGWRAFLERLLRLEVLPDPIDRFPEIDALAVGSVVHGALEVVFGGRCETPLAELAAQEPRRVAWPPDDALAAIALDCARAHLASEGAPYEGLARALAERACTHLAIERDLLDGAALDVLGAEVEGLVRVEHEGDAFDIAFRADLVERASGALRLTDFKTGPSFVSGVQAATAAGRRGKAVAQGAKLQALAYALGAGEGGAVGRYVHLATGAAKDAQPVVDFEADREAPLARAFAGTAATLERCWREGVFAPRLSDAGAPNRACGHCDVSEACVRGDPLLRERQLDWLAAAAARAEAGEALSRAESLHLALDALARAEAPADARPPSQIEGATGSARKERS